jgi:hypothetical protein
MDNVVCKCSTSTRHTIKTRKNVTCPGNNLCPKLHLVGVPKLHATIFLHLTISSGAQYVILAQKHCTKNIIQRLPV